MTHRELILQQYKESVGVYIHDDSRWFKNIRDELEQLNKNKEYRTDKWWRLSDRQWMRREYLRNTINVLFRRLDDMDTGGVKND